MNDKVADHTTRELQKTRNVLLVKLLDRDLEGWADSTGGFGGVLQIGPVSGNTQLPALPQVWPDRPEISEFPQVSVNLIGNRTIKPWSEGLHLLKRIVR